MGYHEALCLVGHGHRHGTPGLQHEMVDLLLALS